MTRRFPRLLAILLTIVAPAVLVAQTGKDMGPAGQFYQPPKTKFKFQPGPKKQGGEIKWHMPPGGHQDVEKDEYAILYPDVTIEYQDIKVHADKATVNLRTKDVVAEGHVILDQGPMRLTADQGLDGRGRCPRHRRRAGAAPTAGRPPAPVGGARGS
ncbi:MAG TPA: LptA/OstA family protein [Actinomycetota bacterium]|nr:LptA/OstA family protein [Actinomycetota bacterium]